MAGRMQFAKAWGVDAADVTTVPLATPIGYQGVVGYDEPSGPSVRAFVGDCGAGFFFVQFRGPNATRADALVTSFIQSVRRIR